MTPEELPLPAQCTPRSFWGPAVVPAVPQPPLASRPSSSPQGAKAGWGRGLCSSPRVSTPELGHKTPRQAAGNSPELALCGEGASSGSPLPPPGDRATDTSHPSAAPMAGKTHPWHRSPEPSSEVPRCFQGHPSPQEWGCNGEGDKTPLEWGVRTPQSSQSLCGRRMRWGGWWSTGSAPTSGVQDKPPTPTPPSPLCSLPGGGRRGAPLRHQPRVGK